MNDLDAELANGNLTLEEWARKRIEMEKQMEDAEQAYKKEKKRIHELQESIESRTEAVEFFQEKYKKNIEIYGEHEFHTQAMKTEYEKARKELERLLIVQEAGIPLTDDEIDRRIRQKEHTEKLTQAENDLKQAKEEYNALKADDSTTRAELEKSRQKVIELTNAYNNLKNSMASV